MVRAICINGSTSNSNSSLAIARVEAWIDRCCHDAEGSPSDPITSQLEAPILRVKNAFLNRHNHCTLLDVSIVLNAVVSLRKSSETQLKMDRRHGVEGMYGIAGGNKVTPESERKCVVHHKLDIIDRTDTFRS